MTIPWSGPSVETDVSWVGAVGAPSSYHLLKHTVLLIPKHPSRLDTPILQTLRLKELSNVPEAIRQGLGERNKGQSTKQSDVLQGWHWVTPAMMAMS